MNMYRKITKGMRTGHKIAFAGLIIGLLGFLALFQIQNNQDIEPSADGAKMKSGDSIISPEIASAIALNSLKQAENGVTLSHPNHSANFEKEGVFFQPKKGPEWAWQLTHIGTESKALDGLPLHEVIPENKNPRIVSYEYGNITEEYHAKQNTVEQRFVLAEPLNLNGQDLIIKGQVTSQGQFEELDQGWAWSDSEGQVKLGDVTVFDAKGQILMASMNVTAQSTEIIVNAHALATATYPVTVDPEIGANDFQISHMGDSDFTASSPAVAYNSQNDEYLVVWAGDGDHEIFGQRIDAQTGDEIGVDFPISDMSSVAFSPDVAYNRISNEYCVVWYGSEVIGLTQVFGQIIDASGAEVGVNDFPISQMTGIRPAIAHSFTNNEYLVVWDSAKTGSEIFAQKLNESGLEIGANDFQISDMGPDGKLGFSAAGPNLAYNSNDNEYLVVWFGDDVISGEYEIFGQRINAVDGTETGGNDFQISDMGLGFDAFYPDVAHNPQNNEYLIAWEGRGHVQKEVFAQRLDANGSEIGKNDFHISDVGTDISADPLSTTPAVTYNGVDHQFTVTWIVKKGLNYEVYIQRLNAITGDEIGTGDFKISEFDFAKQPDIVHSANDCLVVWSGIHTFSSSSVGLEIYGQRIKQAALTSNANTVSIGDGETHMLTLNAPEFAGHDFLVLGSLSGTSPGTGIGNKFIPLNPDAYTVFTLNNLNTPIINNFGKLDACGEATIFVTPPNNPSLIGLTAAYAALILDSQQFTQDVVIAVSNAASVDLAP